MKKLWLIISSLFAINFASAADLSEILGQIDQSIVVLLALFLVSFALAFFSLNKVFKDNTTMAGIIAVTMAFLVVYGINKMGFDTPNFFYNLGVSESTFSLALFIIIAVGIIYMFIKLEKKRYAFLILGALSIGASFFVYAKALLVVIGIALLLIWFFISISGNKNGQPKARSKKANKNDYYNDGAGI
jgi:hypothetical protein